MDIHLLHTKLKSSYTHENLQKITRKIIDLYKNNQFSSIDTVMRVVAEQTQEKIEHQSKAFYKLMMVYHPDRLSYYLSEIEKYHNANNLEKLLRYSHILTSLEMEQTLVVLKTKPIKDEPYRDMWENYAENFGEFDETEFVEEEPKDFVDEFEEIAPGNTFFAIFKKQIYGNAKVELPFYYLEDIDTIDLSGSDIDDLDGIQHCTQLIAIDLSNNRITDISDLSSLSQLQEAYFGNNRIGYIDALSYHTHLRIVDLSNNNIDDLSPLFGLEHLEYVNVVGNAIPPKHLDTLRKKGVMIIY